MNAKEKNPWEEHVGANYDRNIKANFLKPIFDRLEQEGKIGEVIVDVGSSSHPVSLLIPRDRRRILIDIAGPEGEYTGDTKIKFDAEKIEQTSALSYKRALLKAGEYLQIDPKREKDPQKADTIIFSELLNYVDYKKVIEGFSKFLQPEGRIIIVNKPDRGFKKLFSKEGVKNNNLLKSFLEEIGFEIESQDFPWPTQHLGRDRTKEMIVLVARKCEKGEAKEN